MAQVDVDSKGDLYIFGSTRSHPVYFDPLIVDTHSNDGMEDLFVAKLLTSDEKLPPCKTDATTITAGYCFVGSTCYVDGAPSRGVNEGCLRCDASKSPTSLTQTDGSCFIDGVCYSDGEFGSDCQYCDMTISSTAWTVVEGQYVVDKCYNTTWTSPTPTLPEFDWVVVDHGAASTFGFTGWITMDAVFSGGFALFGDINATNFQTGESITSTGLGVGGSLSNVITVYDLFVVRTTLDGKPEAVFTYEGTDADILVDISASQDGAYLALCGLFSGNLTFGPGLRLTSEAPVDPNLGLGVDRFVAMVSATTGDPVWARRFDTEGTAFGATVFDDRGNVFIEGLRCGVFSGQCVALLSADDGSILWELDPVGTGIDFNDDSYGAVSYLDGKFYVTGSIKGGATIGDVTISSSGDDDSDAVMLVLDADDGTPLWAATVTGDGDATSNFLTVKGDAVYVGCVGVGCVLVSSTMSDATVAFQGGLLPPGGAGVFGGPSGGGVVKMNASSGEPLWTADLPLEFVAGVAATDTAVYVDFRSVWVSTGEAAVDQTFGDATFRSWGDRDTFVAKVDAMTGAGQWVLQVGGSGHERNYDAIFADDNGDLYLFGSTRSHPVYFDPLIVDTHSNDGMEDLFVAKLLTSDEKLPPCKTDATTITDGYCFVGSTCYVDGAPSRGVNEALCLRCDASKSQTSLTQTEGSCFIDGVCYSDGAVSSSSECQYCDVATSTSTWAVRDGQYVVDKCYNTTWTTQSAGELPAFDWVVVDHAGGDSWSFFSTVGDGTIFAAGVMANAVNLTNVITGASVASVDEGNDED